MRIVSFPGNQKTSPTVHARIGQTLYVEAAGLTCTTAFAIVSTSHDNNTVYTVTKGNLVNGCYELSIPALPMGTYMIFSHWGNNVPADMCEFYASDFEIQFHISNTGWVKGNDDAYDCGIKCPLTGRTEAIMISLRHFPPYVKLVAQGHSQDYGWLPEVGTGEIIGVPCANKRLEAFKAKLIDTRDGSVIPAGIGYEADNSAYTLGDGLCGQTGTQFELHNVYFRGYR